MKMKDKKMYASPRCTLAPLRSARVGQQRISGSLLPSLDPYFVPPCLVCQLRIKRTALGNKDNVPRRTALCAQGITCLELTPTNRKS